MPKVLLVEDDNNLREIFQMRLQAEGYATVVAADGEEGLAVAMKEKPDLIIADVMMPKLSGFEMVENLRAAPETKDTKIIMMTALGQAEDQARGEKLGVLKYLVKSQVTLEDFARVVKEAVGPGSPNASSGPPAGQVPSTNNNQPESENSMQEDPAASPAPAPDAGAPADPAANPVSGVPADSGTAPADQQTAAQESGVVNDQVNQAMGSPAPDAAAPAAPADGAAPAGGDASGSAPTDPTSNAL
jgi:CheY-like chemotaxis protein